MKKINIVQIVKIASMAASIIGMIGSSWASSKENKAILKDLVNEHFQK